MRPRLLLYGFLSGVLLSASRAPLGLEWTQLVARDAMTAAVFRAAALIAVALFLDAERRAFQAGISVWRLLAAVTVGYSVHGLVLASRWQPESRIGYVVLLLAFTALLWKAAGPARSAASDEEPQPRLPLAERLGLALAAAGATIALDNLAHHVRLYGLGLPEDDTVIGSVFLVTLFVGAAAFGGFLSSERLHRTALAVALAATAGATLVGLWFLSGLQFDVVHRYLQNFGLDSSRIGLMRATAVIAGASLSVPCFVAGAGLAAARHPGRLAAVALGGAVGMLLTPYVVDSQARALDFAVEHDYPWAWNLAALGAAVAAVGAIVTVLHERGRLRVAGIVLAAGALFLPWIRPGLLIWSFSPWYVAEIVPELVMPTATGLVTVERTRGDAKIVTLDRKRLSPTSTEERVDALRIQYAFSFLEMAGGMEPRVLLIGQMTPARARVLAGLGPMRLQRTAPWHTAFEAVENVLFTAIDPAPPGEIVTPVEARRGIREGAYDLVLALPVHGPVLTPKSHAFLPWGSTEEPVVSALDVPDGTVGIAWLDTNSPLVWRDLGEEVILAMDRFQHLTLGVVRGATATPSAARPLLLPGGETHARIGVVALLETIGKLRVNGLRSALMERLAKGAQGTDAEALARGLELHFSAQRPSSPYETLAQQIEIDEEELRAFHEAAMSAESMDAFSRELWEGLGWLLTQKRKPSEVLTFLESVGERFQPWPAIDRAVAQAYQELLEPGEALRLLERVLEAEGPSVELLNTCSIFALEVDEPERAVAYLERALELQPGRYVLERSLGLAQMRAGDAAGRELLERLLESRPGDEEIHAALDPAEEPPSSVEGGS